MPAATMSCAKARAERGLVASRRLTIRHRKKFLPTLVYCPHCPQQCQCKRCDERALQDRGLPSTDQRYEATQNHHTVFRKGRTPVAPTGKYQALIVMLPVRFPDSLATQGPSGKRHARVDNKRGEYQQWEPQRPDQLDPTRYAQRAGKET